MRNRQDETVITAALRDLDPAPMAGLGEAERDRADATFARIVATPSDGPVPMERDRRRRRGSRWTRLLATVGLAGAAGVAVPGLWLGSGGAYGSWTATPEPLTGVDATTAGSSCRTVLDAPGQIGHVAIAERRGEWTYVLLTGPEAEGSCLMHEDLIGHRDPGGQRAKGFFGTYGADPPAPSPLDRDHIDVHSMMGGDTDEGWFEWVEGYVGRDVTGVTVHTSSGLDIEASVRNGRFAAWWPGVVQSSDNPDGESWWYTVHIADGSTRSVAMTGDVR